MPLTSAETIRKKTVQSPEIQEQVANIIQDIDDKIHDICDSESVLDYEMPKDIFIDGLTKGNAQRIIYYKVATAIEEQGYDLTITMGGSKSKSIFHIVWITDMNEEDKKKIDRYLAERTDVAKEARAKKEGKALRKKSINVGDMSE